MAVAEPPRDRGRDPESSLGKKPQPVKLKSLMTDELLDLRNERKRAGFDNKDPQISLIDDELRRRYSG